MSGDQFANSETGTPTIVNDYEMTAENHWTHLIR